MRGMDINAVKIVLKLNCKRIISDKNKSINNNKKASNIEIFFDVKGLSAVLSTFLSKLISIKSLIMHPALRIKKAPIIK